MDGLKALVQLRAIRISGLGTQERGMKNLEISERLADFKRLAALDR